MRCPLEGLETLGALTDTLRGAIASQLRADGDEATAEAVDDATLEIQSLPSLDSTPEDVTEETDISALSGAKAIKVNIVVKAALD